MTLAAALIGTLAACAPERDMSIAPDNGSPQNIAVAEQSPFSDCRSPNIRELETYLRHRIGLEAPEVLQFYNQKFGTDFPAGILEPVFGEFDIHRSNFYYNFEDGQLHFDFIPSQKGLEAIRQVFASYPNAGFRDADEYLQLICSDKNMWTWYLAGSFDNLEHEIGHAFHGEFMRRNGIRWNVTRGTPEYLGQDLVAEGVATYLSSLINPASSAVAERTFSGNKRTPNPYKSFMGDGLQDPSTYVHNPFVYAAGELLVKPILDANFIDGLRLISAELPHPKTVEDLNLYQHAILRRLEKPMSSHIEQR